MQWFHGAGAMNTIWLDACGVLLGHDLYVGIVPPNAPNTPTSKIFAKLHALNRQRSAQGKETRSLAPVMRIFALPIPPEG